MKEKNIRDKLKSFFIMLGNSLKPMSIQSLITISFTLVIILDMLFVGIILYNKFSSTAEKSISIMNQEIMEQININLDYYIQTMIETSNLLENSINYKSLPNDQLSKQMNIILNTRNDIVTLALFSETGEFIDGTPYFKLKRNANITKQDWFQGAFRKSDDFFFSSPHVQNLFEERYNWVVSLSRRVVFNKDGHMVKGILLIDMNFKAIDQLCRSVNLGKKGYIYIVDAMGNIIYHPQQQLIHVGLKYENHDDFLKYVYGNFIQKQNGEKRMITIKTLKYTGWKIAGVFYMDEILATKKEISTFVGLALDIGILIFISISVFISAKISKPIKQLEESMKMVEEGHFDINIDIKGDDEVVQLSKTFNMMISRIRQLMDQILIEQEAKRKSELNALQAQINPHFLYNTLDSIVWMAENEKSQDVITMVTALARLFRISISKGKHIITVQEEITHAENYLIIQKIRYKNKFQFHIDVEDEVRHCKTLKLILQPIIENAIYHGIEYMVDEGFIHISAAILEGKLLFQVRDNGLGMNVKTVQLVFSKELKSKKDSGVGLKNVHERIQLYFGKEYGIEIESELEEGTTVKMWLPLVKEEKDENL